MTPSMLGKSSLDAILRFLQDKDSKELLYHFCSTNIQTLILIWFP